MRTSVLTRSVIAVASLAIGSVALTGTAASATAPEVVTRDLILAVAQQSPSNGTSDELRLLTDLSCDFEENDITGDRYHNVYSEPFVTDNASGVLVTAYIHDEFEEGGEGDVHRWCTFAAVATTDAAFTLSGDALVTVKGGGETLQRASDPTDQSATSALSGNFFVTNPINVDDSFAITSASLVAAGNATSSVNVTTTENTTVVKPRTAAGEKAAKAKYDKRLKAAKKWYAKKLAKAGNSKAKKASVEKTYAAKKAAYKKAYEKVYYMGKPVVKTTVQTEKRPFNISAGLTIFALG